MSEHNSTISPKTLSVIDLLTMKRQGEKISCLTAYDASFSSVIDKAGVDVMLVGDSLGMVIQGHDTTVPVTIEDMVYHTRAVCSARSRAFVVSDMPFMSYVTPVIAARNAAKLMQMGGAQMVKLEGAHLDCIRFLVGQGVPVCGHLGLLPQSIHRYGEYKVRGRELLEAEKIRDDAYRLEEAGAQLLVLECVPSLLAEQITSQLSIPVIGIGAGVNCDGQVLVLYDMLDIGIGKRPRFSKNFMQNAPGVEAAISAYHQAVKQSQFPGSEHSY